MTNATFKTIDAQFTYVFGTDNETDRLASRNGQSVVILRELNDDECDPECQTMYLVQSQDGHEFHAFAEELGL